MPVNTALAQKPNSLRVEVVQTMDQFMHALAVRAICYMEKSNTLAPLPANQALDGNDLQSTQFVTYLGDEPIGSARIRWFKDFAKIERTGFRPDYRNPRYLKFAGNFVFAHIARKGYARAITHATPEYAELWRRVLGFRNADKPAATYFSEPYVELVRDLEVPANALSGASPIEMLFRIEGTWDMPGKYEGA